MTTTPSQYFVPSEEIKKICFVDCENVNKNIYTFYEYPVLEDTLVFLFYSFGRIKSWEKIPEKNKESFICIQAITRGSNAADASLIMHAMRLHAILHIGVVFYFVSEDSIFEEIAVQLTMQGRMCELLTNENLGYHLYLQKNILLHDTSFEKTLRLVKEHFSVKTQDFTTLHLILKNFITEQKIETNYWSLKMLTREFLRRNMRKIKNEKDEKFYTELSLISEKLEKFISRIPGRQRQISISVIGAFLKDQKEFIERYFLTLKNFLEDVEVKNIHKMEIHYRLDGILVLKRNKLCY